ncbi:MAG: hypothetical protein K0S47_1333 [Herbinix sp.]|jgi:hypothetical protein|nr:hypothetical protein [Herbinix sp.]
MRALSYLIRTTLKNRIISLKKKPALLVLYLVIIAGMAVGIVASMFTNQSVEVFIPQDVRIIYGIVAALGILYIYTFINTGLSTGSTLFSMADVGLLFVAPVSSKKILIYGLLKELGKTILTSIFILYQIGNLKIHFGFGAREILALFFIYAVMLFFCQLLSMAIYLFTNGNSGRKKIALYLLYGVIILSAVFVYLYQREIKVSYLETAFRIVDSKIFGYVPIAGWTTMFFKAVVEGNMLLALIALGLYLIFGLLVISLFTSGNADYYEDVLHSTEVRHQTLQAAKDGKRVTNNPKKIKVRDKDTGLKKGNGASVFLAKHILETKRSSRFAFIDAYTIIAVIVVGIASRQDMAFFIPYIILGVLVYLQFFMTVMGRLSVELTKHYIYLVPDRSMKKVFYASGTSLLKPCIDGALIFASMAVMGGAGILDCIFFAMAYASAGAIFVGFTILYQRVLGAQPNKLVQILVGMGMFFLVLTPAIVLTVIFAMMLPETLLFLSTLPFTLCCLLITLILFLCCGNLIDKAEFSGK